MTEDVTDKWLDRVRGLLAKAEATTFPAEAEALRAKAYELIAKKGIDEALLSLEDPRMRRVGDIVFVAHAPFAQQKVTLWYSCSEPLGIASLFIDEWASGLPYRQNRSDRQVKKIQAFGRAGDLERAQLLYTSILLQQGSEFARLELVGGGYYGQSRAAWQRSWLIGYAHRIKQRFSAIVADTASTTGAELVLADIKTEATSAMEDMHPDLRSFKSAAKLDLEAYAHGVHSANKATLSSPTAMPAAPGALESAGGSR